MKCKHISSGFSSHSVPRLDKQFQGDVSKVLRLHDTINYNTQFYSMRLLQPGKVVF